MVRLLVQLSDPHIVPRGTLAYGGVDTAAHLRRAVEAVRRLPQTPAAVVITGDLTDGGHADEYAHLRDLLAPLPGPLYVLPGNHDERGALRGAFAEQAHLLAAAPDDFIQYAVDLGGVRLVVLDTHVPQAAHGALCAVRLRHAAALLEAAPRTPTIVALHHPPFRTLLAAMDPIGLRDGEPALAALIAAHPQVQRVVCGHLHRSIQVHWAGTLAMTAPSTAHQLALDLAPDAPLDFAMEPPGFLVHAWDDDGRIVTHQAAIDAGAPQPQLPM